MKTQSTKLEKGMKIIIDSQIHVINNIETTRFFIKGIGVNGRKSSTDHGKVILTTNKGVIALSKRIKVETI